MGDPYLICRLSSELLSYLFNFNKKIVMLSKVLLASIVAVAMADHAPYHPAPEYKLPPRPFAYEYGVKDEYSGAYFAKQETQDDYGVVTGEYRVALPDGRTQIVTYTADHENGYIADVKYEGEPVYEPAPYHPAPKPAPYHPAPVYHP